MLKLAKDNSKDCVLFCFVFKEKEKLTCKVQKDLFLCTNSVPVQ